MANIPGGSGLLPGSYGEAVTVTKAASVPGSQRILAIIGEGAREETIVSNAIGLGKDGFNSAYTNTKNADGRHFLLSNVPVVSNRTSLYKNGIPLTVVEGSVDGTSFDSVYDAKLEIATGKIELQTASLVDQGGSYYSAYALNTGNGTITSLSLLDSNAPTETWTVRCVSVRRDSFGTPVDGYAQFIAQGSISGVLLDGYGNVVTWRDDSVVQNNGILQLAINYGAAHFLEGDKFTIKVKSGALVKGDSLTATYIAVADINSPEFFTDLTSLAAKHGTPSLSNRLSLGAKIAFDNSPPGVLAMQCAPSIPRRISYSLVTSAAGTATVNDLTFDLPVGVQPDANSNIHFFVTDPVTGVESQIIPNKVAFYDATYTATPTSFTHGTHSYSYTVIKPSTAVIKEGIDGVLTHTTATRATLSSASVTFDISDLSATRSVQIYDATHSGNNVTATIISVANGVITLSTPGGFTTESSIRFRVLDSASSSCRVLFTEDLALTLGQSLRGTIVDTKDASFYDAGWTAALHELSKWEIDMLVPLPSQTISAVFSNCRSHVEAMYQIPNRKERVLIIGAIKGLTPNNLLGNTLAAVEDIGILEGIQGDTVSEILSGNVEDLADYSVPGSYANTYKVFYMYPDEIFVTIGSETVSIDGFFQAAALGGFYAGTPRESISATNKQLSGFAIKSTKLLDETTKEQMAAAGICIVQPTQGGGKVLWGKTTTNSGFPEEEEQSIVFIRNRVIKDLRAGTAGFPGNPEDDDFQSTLFTRVDKLCQSFISRKLITAYRDITVKEDAVEPRQFNVVVSVRPVYTNNWIYIRVEVGT